jgi:regulator of protease activity HflC (stomatin/prohibitin superfamily)
VNKKAVAGVGVGAALAASLVFGGSPVVQIDQTQVGIDYSLGRMTTQDVSQLRQPGLNFKLPFVQEIRKVTVSQQQRGYKEVATYTKDNQKITASLSVFFRVPVSQMIEIYKNNPDWELKLETAIENSYKNALGKEEAQFVAQNREEIMRKVTEETRSEVGRLLGIEITQVLMPNYDFNKEFETAVADAANAKAELSKKQTQLEQERIDAQKAVVRAQGERDSAKAKAEGDAYAIEANARAQAQGTLLQKEAEAKGYQAIVDAIGKENMDTYLRTNKWNGTGGLVPLVNGGGNSTILDARQPSQPVPALVPRP